MDLNVKQEEDEAEEDQLDEEEYEVTPRKTRAKGKTAYVALSFVFTVLINISSRSSTSLATPKAHVPNKIS